MKRLPAEILLKIFQKTPVNESYNCALVCKAWVAPAQLSLYSRVEIDCESRLEKFYNTILYDPQLGNKVKTLNLKLAKEQFYDDSESPGAKVTDLLSKLLPLLPNLEEFVDSVPYNYTPTQL